VRETQWEGRWERRWGGHSRRHSERDGEGDTVGGTVRETVRETQWDSERDGEGDTVGDTVRETVRETQRDNERDGEGDTVGDTVRETQWEGRWREDTHLPRRRLRALQLTDVLLEHLQAVDLVQGTRRRLVLQALVHLPPHGVALDGRRLLPQLAERRSLLLWATNQRHPASS
jgi:Arc/MetJ family transcription regulator